MKSKKNIKSIVVMAALGIIALFFINSSFAANTAKVNVETANLRETADSNSKILKQISINTEVEVLEKDGDWYKVKSGNTTGYLRQDLITVEEGTQTTTNSNTENSVEDGNKNQEEQSEQETVENDENNKQVVEDTKLKIVPSINATDIIEVKKDEKVEIIETINGWVCVQTETTKGWIRTEKLKAVEEQPVEQPQEEQVQEPEETVQEPEVVTPTKLKTSYINTQTVNLRKEASKDSDVVAKLSLNTAVDVYSEENGWSKVKVGEKEGYIATSLLSNKKQETSRNLETPRETATTTNQKQESATTKAPTSGKGATVVETAKNYIGSKYVYGAAGPNSFDCSGFTSYIYKQHGVSLNRTAAAQYSNGVAVSRDQLQPGDLIMFGKSGINHVGIYIGGGQMVHAANASRGVTTDTINSGYYNNNYVGARRVI